MDGGAAGSRRVRLIATVHAYGKSASERLAGGPADSALVTWRWKPGLVWAPSSCGVLMSGACSARVG